MVSQLESEGSEHVLWAIGKKSPLTLRFVPRLKKFLTRQNVDILHLRSRVPAWVGYLAWRTLPEKSRPHLVTTFHGFYSVNKYSAIMTKGEKVIAISKMIEDHLQNVYHVPEENIVLIHRGVDTETFDPGKVSHDRIQALQSAWAVSAELKPLIMLPGRVTSWKGHDIFLESLARIADLRWSAVCVGELDRNSAHVKRLMDLLKLLQLEKRVIFVEHCSDMPAAYSLADIVVSASSTRPEAFGRIIVEAMAMGRPVIATAHGGSMETVFDGVTGWLVPPNDVDSMANALREAVTDKTRTKQYGDNGIKWVGDNFTVEKMCQKTILLYYNLIG